MLETGNFLALCKPDMSFSIHGGSFIKPLNYQNPKSTIELLRSGPVFDDMTANLFSNKPKLIISVVNKKESLKVAVYNVLHQRKFVDWTTSKIKLVRSERDLVNQIVSRIGQYYPAIDIVSTRVEVPTPYGNIDIMIIDKQGIRHVIEVKRKIMSVAGCGQVARYGNYLRSRGQTTMEYVMAPTISKNAMAYAAANNQTWIAATFDTGEQHGTQ